MLHAQIVGNVGNEPELKYSASGSALLRFNVASNYRVKSQSGEWEDRTEWIRCTVFGQRAETLGQYLHKGTKVFVDGRLEARPWTDNSGSVRAGLELVAGDVEFMSARQDDSGQQQRPAARAQVTDDDDLIPF